VGPGWERARVSPYIYLGHSICDLDRCVCPVSSPESDRKGLNMRTFARLKVAFVAAAGIVVISCGQSHSPVTPSPLVAPVTSAATEGEAPRSSALGVGHQVLSPEDKGHEGEGRVTRLVDGTSCPTLRFMVDGVFVSTTAATRFDDGSCSDILAGVKIEAKGTRQLDGSIVASRIEIKDRAGDEVEGEGRVTSLVDGTSCPTLQF